MLDDLKLIAQRDHDDALGIVERQTKQLEQKFDVELPEADFKNVVVAGMGGSMHAAKFVRSWPGLDVPYELVSEYDIPKYVGKGTLFVASSYSGNTEEALSSIEQALKTEATVVVIAAGGKLLELAEQKSLPLAKLDDTIPQPRLGAFNNLKALLSILTVAKLVDEKCLEELENIAPRLDEALQLWKADSGTSQNLAKQIANELMGKSVVIYSSDLFMPVAARWRIAFQENAKNVAWSNVYPEYNHNEFIGWSSHPVEKPYGLINIVSNLDIHEYKRDSKLALSCFQASAQNRLL